MLTTNRKKTFRRIFSYKFGCRKKTLTDFHAPRSSPSKTGEGKRRNEFAEWHVAWLGERHNYAECNICRRPFLAPMNSQVAVFWSCGLDYDDNQKSRKDSLIPHGRLAICTATKILLAFIGRAAGSTDTTSRKSAIEEKMFWKVSISRSRSLPSSSFHDCDVKVPNFTFCGGRGHKTTSFFSLTLIQSFKTQLQKHLPTFDELIGMESARIHFSSEVFVTVVVA